MTRLLLLASTSLFALTDPATAEPVSLAVTAFTAFLASTTVAGISLGAILQVGLVAGSIALQALARPGRRGIDPGEVKGTLKLTDAEEFRAVGRVKIGGVLAWGNSEGFNRWRLMAHMRGPWAAVEEYFLGGRSVVVEADGAVSTPPYVRPGGLSYVYVKSKSGTSTETAWSELVSAFAGIWTTDHRGRGVAQSLIQYISPGVATEKFGRLYQGGVPELEIVVRAEMPYDPRTATTGWTDNSIILIRHVLLGFPEWDASMIDDDFISDEADRADELVSTLTGTEKRSRLWGVFSSEISRGDLLSALLQSAGARIVLRPGGLYGIQLIDDVQTAEVEIAERDLVDWSLKFGPDGVDRPNLVRVKYYSPEVGYDMAEINTGFGTAGGSWARIEDEITAYGEKPLDLDLTFCPSASQAQRIARREFAMARADGGEIITNMAGMAAWGCSTALIPMPDLGDSVVAEISPPRVDAEGFTVNIPYRILPDLPTWNPATMESPAPEIVPDLAYQSDVETPGTMSDAIVVQYIGSGAYETRVRLYPPTTYTAIEANYRTFTSGLPNPWQSMSEDLGLLDHAYVAANLVGVDSEFRSRAFDADDNGSAASVTYAVTPALSTGAPSAPTVDAVVSPPDISGTQRTVSLTVTAPADLKVVRLELSGVTVYPGTSATTQVDARPGTTILRDVLVPINTPGGATVVWTARCYSTGNVASSDVTYTHTIPAS